MAERIHDVVKNLLDGIHGIAKSETVVGVAEPAGDAMVIPVHRVRMAFGVGSAKAGARGERHGGETGGMAAGGGIELDPIAAIAIGRDGVPKILTVDGDAQGGWGDLVREAPELMGKVISALGDRVSTEVKHRLESSAEKAKPEVAAPVDDKQLAPKG